MIAIATNFSVTLHSYRYITTIYACIVGATSQSVQGITACTQIQQQIMGNTDSKQCTFYIPCVYIYSYFYNNISPSYYSHTHISHME